MNFIILITIIIAALLIWKLHHEPVAVVTTIVIALMIISSCWELAYTEGGKRTIKDLKSNFSGGIHRQVKVYDVNGRLIEEYEGTFDIETDHNNYILFDDENGLRHVIYFTTGTIVVDELEK